MRLYEYQSKSLFAQFGIPIPLGKIATTPQEVADIAHELNQPVVLKPQVLNKTHNINDIIKLAQTPEIAKEYAFSIMGEQIDDQLVQSILVEAAVTVTSEIYIAIVNNYEHNKPVMIVAEKTSGELHHAKNGIDTFTHETINPFIGFLEYQARDLASSINLPFEYWKSFTKITQDLFRCYVANDALVAEINSLVIADKNEFVALNGTIIIDDNALYRQPEAANIGNIQQETEPEIQAHKIGMPYKKLGGQITCAVNGSGLAMSIADMISLYGNETIKPVNFIDMGEEAQANRVETALRIILNDTYVKVAFINIFGGVTGCDILAINILQILKDTQTHTPIIIRLTGERAYEGQDIIKASEVSTVCHALTLTEAVQKVVAAVSTQ